MIKSCWHYFLIGFVLLTLSSNAFGGDWFDTKLETDSDGDGEIDSIIYKVYDADGAWRETRRDNNVDGTMDSITYYSYNINGCYEVVEEDYDADGTIDEVQYCSVHENTKIYVIEYDSDADGTIDTCEFCVFDSPNVPSMMKHYEGSGPYDGTGTLIFIEHYIFDENCNKIQVGTDEDADGQIDEIIYRTYDEKCRLITEKTDTGNDGDLETEIEYTYDEGGLECQAIYTQYGFSVTVYLTNTYDGNGYATKTESSSGSIVYYTYEYFEDAESSGLGPYDPECGCSDYYNQDDTSDAVSPVSVGFTGSFESNEPVTASVLGTTTSDETLYYKFYYCANYGTSAYETSPWVVMQDYSTASTCQYTFPADGSYIVVVRVVTDPDNEPDNLPIIGGVVTIGDTENPNIGQLYSDASGAVSPNTPVTYTISASDAGNDDVYYKWFYRSGYGTDDYESMSWVVVQEYSLSTTCEFTFPDAGDYIVVVRAVTDPNNEPTDLPIIGGTVTCRE